MFFVISWIIFGLSLIGAISPTNYNMLRMFILSAHSVLAFSTLSDSGKIRIICNLLQQIALAYLLFNCFLYFSLSVYQSLDNDTWKEEWNKKGFKYLALIVAPLTVIFGFAVITGAISVVAMYVKVLMIAPEVTILVTEAALLFIFSVFDDINDVFDFSLLED